MQEIRTTAIFDRIMTAWADMPRYIVNEGGTRSGKTWQTLAAIYAMAATDKRPTLTSIVSETMPHLKRGAIRDFQTMLGDAFREDAWNKSDSIYTLPNGSRIEFFSADQPGKVHGPARDRLFINEAVNIPYEVARQLAVRTRGRILIDYNPTHAFWVHERIVPRDDCRLIHSTYKDNPFLTPAQVAEIESNRSDEMWWRVYGEGLVGRLQGAVLDFGQVDAMPDAAGLREVIGLDWGFTNDPTAIVRLLIDTRDKTIYAEQLCYERRMLNAAIVERLAGCGVQRYSTPVYCDCAEPKSIEELCRAGYNALPGYKATRVAEQLQWLRGWRLLVTKDSLDLISEGRNYTWAKDKDGHDLNEPIDKFNHAIDALRYAAFTDQMANGGQGIYDIRL